MCLRLEIHILGLERSHVLYLDDFDQSLQSTQNSGLEAVLVVVGLLSFSLHFILVRIYTLSAYQAATTPQLLATCAVASVSGLPSLLSTTCTVILAVSGSLRPLLAEESSLVIS